MARVTETWFVENSWTCSSCQADDNPGRLLNCRYCGARKPKDAAERMGLPDNPVTDPELLKQAKAGPNWVCEYCGGQERDLRGDCTQCGGPKAHRVDNSDLNELLQEEFPVAQVHSYHGVENHHTVNLKPWWTHVEGMRGWANKHPTAAVVIPLSVAGGGMLLWFFIWLFTPRYVDVKVEDVVWTYTANLRHRTQLHTEEWGRPGTRGFYNEPAFNVSCERRYYGDEDCNPHDCHPHSQSYSCNCTSYDCNCSTSCSNSRNGFSNCSRSCGSCSRCDTCYRTVYDTCYDRCSVYKDWCSYDYYDWPIASTQMTSGHDHAVYWPYLVPASAEERVQKIQNYKVLFSCPDDKYEYEPDSLLEYKRFSIGDAWRLQVGKIRDHHIEGMQKK